MLSNTVLILLASFVGAQAETISGLRDCPYRETEVNTFDGGKYKICPGTDYQGQTKSVSYGFPSAYECAMLCSETRNCRQSVYEPGNGGCHLKSGDLKWVKSDRYQAIHINRRSQQQRSAPLNGCPTRETMETIYGVTIASCPNTDFEGETKAVMQGARSTKDCAAMCAKTPGCRASVYERANSQCHIKSGRMVWKANSRYSTSRLAHIPSNGSRLDNCPDQFQVEGGSGSVFYACINADWKSNSLDIIGGVDSVQACANICGNTLRCTKSTWDAMNMACHIKGDSTLIFNQGFTSLLQG
ncbi:hypothetical protein J1614_000885 [Plenodomus biglobosus]|nr:hypothetical protein J1614_000885 [Plenodomus biglobosus]